MYISFCCCQIGTQFLHAKEYQYICYDKWPDALPPFYFTPNQCGPDSTLADIIPNEFGSVKLGKACNEHDRCWMELKDENQYGRCEARFTKDLIEACSKAKKCWKGNCIPNPMEIMACESMVVPVYSGASISALFLLQLQKTRDEQKAFEACVKKYGYSKRSLKKKK